MAKLGDAARCVNGESGGWEADSGIRAAKSRRDIKNREILETSRFGMDSMLVA
jgi:hypothetical protein